MVLDASPDAMLVPATPGRRTSGLRRGLGFDSLEECFDDLAPHIYASKPGCRRTLL